MTTPALTSLAPKLSKAGFSDHAIAGIIANLHHESGGDPEAVGDNGSSFGLGQWHDDRARNLMEFAKAQGMNPRTADAQHAFLIHELQSDEYRGLVETMNRADNARSAAMLFQQKYERPAEVDSARGDTAESVAGWMQRQKAVQPAFGALDRLVDPVARPVGRGIADIVQGAGQLVAHAVGSDEMAANADKGIAQSEEAYQAGRAPGAGFDWGRTAGNILGTLPLAAVGGPGIVGGALAGGASGALQPVPESGDYWREKGLQAGTGAAGGALGSALLGGVARVISPRASQNEAVQTLLREGVTPTPGQMMGPAARATEAKITSIPLVGDLVKSAQQKGTAEFNTAAANRALRPIGEKVTEAPGHGMISEVESKLSAAYNDVLPKMRLQADQQLATDLTNLAQLATELPATQASRFRQVLDQTVLKRMPTGTADGETVKVIQSKLGGLARNYTRSGDADQRELGKAIGSLKQHLDAALERSNPQLAPQLRDINRGWANFERLRRAAASTGADEGIFSPTQLQQAVRAKGGERAAARGDALMQDLSGAGKSVLGQAYPDSGTAGRALLAAVLAGGAPAATGSPAALLAPLLAGAYMPGGRQAVATLLARRPSGAREVSEVVRQLGLLSGPAAGAIAGQ